MAPVRILFFTLSIVLLSACSTISSRIQQQQELFDSYPPATQVAIQNGEVKVGFNADMVQMALGKPSHTALQATTDGTLTTLSFSKKRPGLGFSIGGGSFGGSTSVGAGVGVSTPPQEKFTHIVDLVDGKVSQIRYFSD
ncbi:MAG: hypothetical protein ACR2PS_15605 [Pseudomonadales bacterium]